METVERRLVGWVRVFPICHRLIKCDKQTGTGRQSKGVC